MAARHVCSVCVNPLPKHATDDEKELHKARVQQFRQVTRLRTIRQITRHYQKLHPQHPEVKNYLLALGEVNRQLHQQR